MYHYQPSDHLLSGLCSIRYYTLLLSSRDLHGFMTNCASCCVVATYARFTILHEHTSSGKEEGAVAESMTDHYQSASGQCELHQILRGRVTIDLGRTIVTALR